MTKNGIQKEQFEIFFSKLPKMLKCKCCGLKKKKKSALAGLVHFPSAKVARIRGCKEEGKVCQSPKHLRLQTGRVQVFPTSVGFFDDHDLKFTVSLKRD